MSMKASDPMTSNSDRPSIGQWTEEFCRLHWSLRNLSLVLADPATGKL
jgi:hypothetical protein